MEVNHMKTTYYNKEKGQMNNKLWNKIEENIWWKLCDMLNVNGEKSICSPGININTNMSFMIYNLELNEQPINKL